MLPGPITDEILGNERRQVAAFAFAALRRSTRDPISENNAGSIAASPLGGQSNE
jgi:hypothetical protein